MLRVQGTVRAHSSTSAYLASSALPGTLCLIAVFARPCSVKLLRWPERVVLRLYERGALAHMLLAEIPVNVPGAGGTPHRNAAPVPYSWTSKQVQAVI